VTHGRPPIPGRRRANTFGIVESKGGPVVIEDESREAWEDHPVGQRAPVKANQRRTVSVEEAARLLGISRGHAYALVDRGEIPGLRLGRRIVVPLGAIDRLLNVPDDAA
jgi:excisionase family DNA binding protein